MSRGLFWSFFSTVVAFQQGQPDGADGRRGGRAGVYYRQTGRQARCAEKRTMSARDLPAFDLMMSQYLRSIGW